MNRHLHLLTLLCLPFAASCFQKGPGREGVAPPPVDAGDINVQCASNSAACFTLCGSPECALPDSGLPPVLEVPKIWYQPGGSVNSVGSSAPAASTDDPCVAINDASQTIRKRSCAPCHDAASAPLGTQGHFNYVLDDMMLKNASDNSRDGKIMVIPGDPKNSYVYQRIVTGLRGTGSGGMPPDSTTFPGYLGSTYINSHPNPVIYPSAADVSVLYAWIVNCMPGTDGGAYQANYGSGLHGPAADGGSVRRD